MEKKNCSESSPQIYTYEQTVCRPEYYPLQTGTDTEKKTLLLHSCCGPCSTACIERVLPNWKVTVFYFNPCITDPEEYERRKAAQIQFLNAYNQELTEEEHVDFIEGCYDPDSYFKLVEGYEAEPEGGARCTLCFQQRLEAAARFAKEESYYAFGTTLTVSPHKNYPLISAIGNQMSRDFQVEFLDLDFKKKAGFQRSTQMSKEYGLYRQNYCGCEFSKWE